MSLRGVFFTTACPERSGGKQPPLVNEQIASVEERPRNDRRMSLRATALKPGEGKRSSLTLARRLLHSHRTLVRNDSFHQKEVRGALWSYSQ